MKKSLVKSTNENGEKLFTSSTLQPPFESSFNEFVSEPVEISKANVIENTINLINQDKITTEEPVKLSIKKSKIDLLQKSTDTSLQLHYASEERNLILKSYYTTKLNLLERIAIAKEKKVALMEANSKFKE
ncbi:Uncharacterized protein FWK35_00023623 [Aphis craccivora]|uniref:Uncharacterized protein n=1 Tax=Aphis craccivora TaxID=307492 RepID=A0A6G0Y7E4_APHCR|nr:Uncharacterized protein FWK35_00023623 [Aphis craccivora]